MDSYGEARPHYEDYHGPVPHDLKSVYERNQAYQATIDKSDGDLKVEQALYKVLEDSSEDYDTDVDFVFTSEGLKALTFDKDGFVNGTYQIKVQVTQTGGTHAVQS